MLSRVKIDGRHWSLFPLTLSVLLDGAAVGCGRSGSTETVSSRRRSAGAVEATTTVEVITAVEKAVVTNRVSKTVEVIVTVAVVNAVLFCETTRVVNFVC